MRSRVLAIVVAVVVPLAALGVVIAQRDSSDSPDRLPILTGGGGSRGGDAALALATEDAALYPYGVIVYTAGTGLPELDGSARAYKVTLDGVAEQLERLKELLVTADEPSSDRSAMMFAEPNSPYWSFSRQTSDGVVSSSGVAVACAPDRDCPAPDTTIPERPADLPSEEEAKRIALDLLQGAGIDTSNAAVAVDDFVTQWSVRVDPVVDGLPIEGMTTTVTIGAGGVVEYANGILGRPEAADEYPLIGTRAAIDRLNAGEGFVGPQPLTAAAEDAGVATGAAEPGSAGGSDPNVGAPDTVVPEPPVTGTIPPPPPQEITLTGAEQILLYASSYTGEESWLVPAYRFTTDEGVGPSVLAIDDRFLTPPDQIPVDKGVEDPDGTVTIEPRPGIEPVPPATEPAPAVDPAREEPATGG